MSITKHRVATGIICLLMAIVSIRAGAQSSGSAAKSPAATAEKPAASSPSDLAFVFSTSGILSGFEAYQSGLGGKFGWGGFGLRVGLDVLVDKESQTFSLNVGTTGEHHLAPGPISPYLGWLAQVGYVKAGELSSAIPFTVGAVAGVEVFVLDFLSIFVEYCAALDLEVITDLQTSETSFNYTFDTRMGNNSKLGIVIYLKRTKPTSLLKKKT